MGEATPNHQAKGQDARALAEVRVREKRWAVYVERAVDRFAKWWDACVPATLKSAPCEMLTGEDLCKKRGIDRIAYEGIPIRQLLSKERLPPIGSF